MRGGRRCAEETSRAATAAVLPNSSLLARLHLGIYLVFMYMAEWRDAAAFPLGPRPRRPRGWGTPLLEEARRGCGRGPDACTSACPRTRTGIRARSRAACASTCPRARARARASAPDLRPHPRQRHRRPYPRPIQHQHRARASACARTCARAGAPPPVPVPTTAVRPWIPSKLSHKYRTFSIPRGPRWHIRILNVKPDSIGGSHWLKCYYNLKFIGPLSIIGTLPPTALISVLA